MSALRAEVRGTYFLKCQRFWRKFLCLQILSVVRGCPCLGSPELSALAPLCLGYRFRSEAGIWSLNCKEALSCRQCRRGWPLSSGCVRRGAQVSPFFMASFCLRIYGQAPGQVSPTSEEELLQ